MFQSDDILVLHEKYQCIPSQRYIYSFPSPERVSGSQQISFEFQLKGGATFFITRLVSARIEN